MNKFSEKRMGREGNPAEMLKGRLAAQSRELNDIIKREYGLDSFVLPDGTLDPNGYAEIFGQAGIAEDQTFIYERERDFSGATEPRIQDYYRTQYGVKTEEEHIAKWREKKSRAKNTQMEMAVSVLLAEKLGADFIVVRTAAYDDYANGVDNLILDRRTGEVVGAFDEVHEGGDGRDTEKKKKKVQKIAERGGAKIRYGMRLSGGRLTRASLANVPVFYLQLGSAELTELEEGIAREDSAKTDRIYEKLIDSLRLQHTELSKSAGHPGLRTRLASFGQSLERISHKNAEKSAA